MGTLTTLTAGRSSLGFLATFWNSESDISESELEESNIALDLTLSDSFILGEGRSGVPLIYSVMKTIVTGGEDDVLFIT